MVIHDSFLYFFVPLKIGMNTLRSRHKQCDFNSTKSPHYLVKVKVAQKGRPLTAVRHVNILFQTFAESRSVFCSFISQLVRKFFQQFSGSKYFIFAWVFIRNLSSNLIWLILAYEPPLNCRDLRCVTVMAS